MKELKLYKCEICGNLSLLIDDKKVPMTCCGKKMTKVEANTTDAVMEKHVPQVDFTENEIKVSVGSIEHPMTEEHLITWIFVVSENDTIQAKEFNFSDKPVAKFTITGNSASVYSYCNIHGLWLKEVKK